MQTDTTGSFQVNMRMPADLAPRTGYVITATSSGPRFGALTFPGLLLAQPASMPTLTLDRSEGTAGSSLRLTGAHWVPGDVVTLEYCRGSITQFGVSDGGLRCDPYTPQGLGETRVGQNGRFQAHVTLPVAARLGEVTIQARVPGNTFG